MPAESNTPSSSFEGDFAPGEILIGRYRIVALVGEGGMGQVYVADDLVLGQPVAVKFLPEHIAQREDGLERFRAEVRHAREVTHPNVARVHDIGEVDGRHFLTMEFVDGEDLASLVKRIGRLPREKAAEIAQQVCAGLAEAHRKDVLHRDLKPANVMLDGEGRVRLTDFGLAVTAGADAPMAGTPQYMAPEQLAGVPASVRSEVYSLGLVLYELYTGRRALRGRTLDELRREHEEGPVRAPSSVLADIDERVDGVLTRCLARAPEDRPASVREVARALPGGDPLAAALAAGVTPSPEVVAAAGSEGALAPRTALALLLGSAALLIGLKLGYRAIEEQDGFSYGKPAAVLRERAREIATELVGDEELPHEIHWYEWDAGMATLNESGADPAVQPLVHHSRFGPEPIVATGTTVSANDPAPIAGSVHVALDAGGTLLSFRHVIGDTPVESEGVPEITWSGLLERAGFEPGTLRPTGSRRAPPDFASERRAWEGADAGGDYALRIEAASIGDRPVHFAVNRGDTMLGAHVTSRNVPGGFAWFIMLLTVVAAVVAWRNVRSRRADVAGGLAVGLFALVTHVVLVFGQHLPDTFVAFGAHLFQGVSYSVHTGVRVTVFYLALEPFARRRWPSTLISWSRLLEGRSRDPAVGREALIGIFAALAVHGLSALVMVALRLGGVAGSALPGPVTGLAGPLQTLSHLVHGAGDAVMFAGMLVFVLVVLRSFVRFPWLANGLWMALLVAPVLITAPGKVALFAYFLILAPTLLLLLTRVGFLAVVVSLFLFFTVWVFPISLNPGDWIFPSSLMTLGSLTLLTIWAHRAAVAGKSVFDVGTRDRE